MCSVAEAAFLRKYVMYLRGIDRANSYGPQSPSSDATGGISQAVFLLLLQFVLKDIVQRQKKYSINILDQGSRVSRMNCNVYPVHNLWLVKKMFLYV